MSASIKTREISHDIKTKNNRGNLNHFIKQEVLQSKSTNIGSKKENAANEVEATEQVQASAFRTTSSSAHRMKNYVKDKSFKTKKNNTYNKQHNPINLSKNSASDKSRNKLISNSSSRMKRLAITKHTNGIKERKELKYSVNTSKNMIEKIFKGSITVVKKVTSSLSSLFGVGGGLILLLVITLFIGVFGSLSSSSVILPGTSPLSDEVIAYYDTIEKYAKRYNMEEYIVIIQAIMMQESEGKGKDPMNASKSEFNTLYPKGINDSEYSIDVGIHTLSDYFKKSSVKDSSDSENIYLGIQSYNFGKEYIQWAITNFDGYSKANAKVYAEMKCGELRVSSFGDYEYVEHVMQYVSLGFGDIRSAPNFDNLQAWGYNNPYSAVGLYGQCTWFAWGRFYEIYGYSPGFTGDGYQCARQLVNAHPDKWKLSDTPEVGSVYSAVGHNHVGIVIGWDGENVTVQDGNLDGRTNTFQEAKKDWSTSTYTLSTLRSIYGGVKFAIPKQ